jgi:hypothetical protein
VPSTAAKNYAREISFLDRIGQRYPLTSHDRVILTRKSMVSIFEDSQPSLSLAPIVGLLGIETVSREARPKVVVGGEGADELVGSFGFNRWDWALSMPLWRCFVPGSAPSVKQALRWWFGRRGAHLLGKAPVEWPSIRTFFSGAISEMAMDYHASLIREARQMPLANRQAWLIVKLMDFQAPTWEYARDMGLRRVLPFRSREMLECTLAAHPGERIGRVTKLLLRRSLRNDVAPEFLDRSDKGGFGEPQDRTPVSTDALRKMLSMFPDFDALLSPETDSLVGAADEFRLLYLVAQAKRHSEFLSSISLAD